MQKLNEKIAGRTTILPMEVGCTKAYKNSFLVGPSTPAAFDQGTLQRELQRGYALGWSPTFRLPCIAGAGEAGAFSFVVGHASKPSACIGVNWKNRSAMLLYSATHERVRKIIVYPRPDYRGHWPVVLVGIRQRLAGPAAGRYSLRQGKFQFSFPYRYLPAHQRHPNHTPLAVPKMRHAAGCGI